MHNLLHLCACIFIKVLLKFFFFLREMLAWWFECLKASFHICHELLSSAVLVQLFEERFLGLAALGLATAAVGGPNLTSSEF